MKDLEQYERMHREVETLGNENNYHGQAQAFLRGTGTTIEARFHALKAGQFGPDDTEPRDVYEIRITRNGRVYTFMYGDSIKDTEERIERLLGPRRADTGAAIRKGYRIPTTVGGTKLKNWAKLAGEWTKLETAPAMNLHLPRAYDILAALTKYEPESDIDAFAREFGIEKVSEALRVHRAVLDEYQNMRALFDNDELETLCLIS